MKSKTIFIMLFILGVTALTGASALVNPASEFCLESGNTVKVVTASDGSQTGYCVSPIGEACNEWDFYYKCNSDLNEEYQAPEDISCRILCPIRACSDSDQGKNYYVKGQIEVCNIHKSEEPTDDVVIGCEVYEDYCSVVEEKTDDQVYEYSCEGNEVELSSYDCPFGCNNGACKFSPSFGYTVGIDKKTYDLGDIVNVQGYLYGQNAEKGVIKTWVKTPEDIWHQVAMSKDECQESEQHCSDRECQEYCIFQGSYVVGRDYPKTTLNEEELSIFDHTTASMEIPETAVVSISELKEPREEEITDKTLTVIRYPRNQYIVFSLAKLGDRYMGAWTKFYVSWYPEAKIELRMESNYDDKESIEIVIENTGDSRITYYDKCVTPYYIEKLVDGEFEKIHIHSPCQDRCVDRSTEILQPSQKVLVGVWSQKLYDSICNNDELDSGKFAGPGIYKVVFNYQDSVGNHRQSIKKFTIGSKETCIKVCKYQGTGNEGWYNSCTDELIEYASCAETPPTYCQGCGYENSCLPYGTRLIDKRIAKYCDISSKLMEQKGKEVVCQNNYECSSNSCISGVCTDLAEELRETRSMLAKILDWLNNLFG